MTRPEATGLPVEECIGGVREALADGGVRAAVLCAPPGAGKTTVVPLRLLDEPWLGSGKILVLEPRRLATRAASRRMASLLGEDVGQTVGYSTRDERVVSRGTRVEVVTEGILTRRLQHDPSLPGVGLVVFDEVHERNLQTDLALALTLDVRPQLRPDLRLLAMSATIDTGRMAALLGESAVGGGAVGGSAVPIITSEGRQHPVDIRWVPPRPRQRLAEASTGAVLRALREQDGDVLVFLPGAGDIRRVEGFLTNGGLPAGVDVRPLFGALPTVEQDLALTASPPGRRRVVLATDIAETSLTVAGVRTVVDGGQYRTPRYDARTGLTKLHTVAISRASADQRAGRAGRTEPGVAYRLWSKLEQAARRPFPDPEIATVDLAGLVLELAVWGTEPSQLRFLDPPPPRAVEEARALLEALGALDADGRPTPEGRAMSELPLHPRLARMVTGSLPRGMGWTACVLAALLEDRDVLRGKPDEVPVDVAERVRLIVDRGASHPAIDGPAVGSARRRTQELARRVGVEPGSVDVSSLGRALALAYPDRVAQARGGGRFRLRTGTGAWLPQNDPLAGAPFLVLADLDAGSRDSRVRMAAALAPADLEEAAGGTMESVASIEWDVKKGDLRAAITHRLDGLVLATTNEPVPPGRATTAALVDRVRSTRLTALRWTDAARSLQARAAFLRRTLGEEVPDVSDEALLHSLDDWLVPLLVTAIGKRDLEAVDVIQVLRRLLGHQFFRQLDELAPISLPLPGGRSIKVSYAGDQPTASVRVQDLFGTDRHPTVAGGRVPVVLQLLSPAGRPVQVTADLPGFWSGSYASVRKDMAGRYPKHPWPADPASARPPGRKSK